MSISKRWCFTLNNFKEEDLDRLRSTTEAYMCWQQEIGESGTPHLQGYVTLKVKKRMSYLKTLIGERAHLEPAKGTPKQAREYCKKPDTAVPNTFEELGTLETNQGKRSDIETFKDAVKDGLLCKKRAREEHSEIFAKYPRFCIEYLRDQTPLPPIQIHPLRDWQGKLNSLLNLEIDDRKINFVVDLEGNTGKTWFSKYYLSLHPENTQILESGKKADMALALAETNRVLFVNVTRTLNEFMSYSFLESVKDGMVFSPKYESGMKVIPPCHVVVTMNQMPDMSALSRDRYNVIEI